MPWAGSTLQQASTLCTAVAQEAEVQTVHEHAGDLSKSYAHWLERGTLAWRGKGADADGGQRRFVLHWSRAAALRVAGGGVEGGDGQVPLEAAGRPLPHAVVAKFPHLAAACAHLRLPGYAAAKAGELLKGQLALAVHAADGRLIDVTGVQTAGVLDDVFYYDGPLGAQIDERGVALRVWAPTAQRVEVLLFEGPRGGQPRAVPMQAGSRGEWTCQGPADWEGKYYKYRVTVFCPWTNNVETAEATDPYARSLAADGERVHITRLDDPAWMPPGWETHSWPGQRAWTDTTLYELHIRDFSISDETCPPEHRGKYTAFCQADSAGVRHLAALRQAGMTHVHLLPAYDFGSVPERPEDQLALQEDLSQYPPDGEQQQAAVAAIADADAFNWGYDPVHWGVPEGSYASSPDGGARVREFRDMVAALHGLGLRVVLDVVYNHVYAAGMHSAKSVLDKLVPGYYHRRGEDGAILQSTCCNNTAPEHAMCERLIVEDLVHWAVNYKVDGFRFDIMGHLPLATMRKVQAALAGLMRASDGVDGSQIYVYGEAWDFGEMACNQRGRNAAQLNIGGTGLGSFNDRFRDALLGGSPFAPARAQGWLTGLALAPNSFTADTQAGPAQVAGLAAAADLLRASIAGNLKNYALQNAQGQMVQGKQLRYHLAPAAYALQPHETVNYAGCHDGETLFDQIMLKAPDDASVEDRVRMCQLAMALVALSQGVAFFHAGDELLRSKSLDRDSYNSGDWFNRLDWSGLHNNFGVGLPPAAKNREAWPLKRPLLARAAELTPSPALIAAARAHFLELLRIRKSTPLLRLPRAEHIARQLRFHATGPLQIPGVIALELRSADVAAAESGSGPDSLDPTSSIEAAALSNTSAYGSVAGSLLGSIDLPQSSSLPQSPVGELLSGSGEGVTDPRWARLFIVFNARPDAVNVDWPPGAARVELHPVQAASQDAGVRASTAAGPGGRCVTVAGRTAAVFIEPRT